MRSHVDVLELDRLLNEVRYGVLDNSPERVDKAADAIRTLFTSTGSPETHSERNAQLVILNTLAERLTDEMDNQEGLGASEDVGAGIEKAFEHVHELIGEVGQGAALDTMQKDVPDTTPEDVEVCEWRKDKNDRWKSACGVDGFGPAKRLDHCPKCGKPLRVVSATQGEDTPQ